MPSINPADGSLINGFSSGLNKITLPPDIGNSVVFGQVNSLRGLDEGGKKWGEFNSHLATSNKPYVIITYDDLPPTAPSSLYPSGITLNPRDIIKFSWLHNSNEGLQQKSFALEYSTDSGSTWTTINQTTPNQYYDMPASTLPTSGTVLWRVSTTDGNDEVSGYTSASFTLGIVPQVAPIPIAPISQYMDQTKVIRFEWSFLGGASGETQSKFDLQYSTNGGTSWTTVTLSTASTYHELLANTLSSGNITWRIRTYNNWDEVSPYSENRTFTVIGSPPIPLLSSIGNSARPIISWQATGQHIYELQILQGEEVLYNTGSIPSTNDRSIKVPIYLKDGNYTTRLRIFNEYNLSSPWAQKNFTISTAKPDTPVMQLTQGKYYIGIVAGGLAVKTLVYRDGEYIGEVKNNYFADYTGENNKEYEYLIRTIDENDNFNDSDIKLARCNFSGNTLALAYDPGDFVRLKYGLDSIPKKTNSISNQGSLIYYDGRRYPITERAQFRSKVKNIII